MQISENDFLKPKAERGAAGVNVTLHGGIITVTRNDDNKVLIQRPAYQGDWNLIWNALEGYNG